MDFLKSQNVKSQIHSRSGRIFKGTQITSNDLPPRGTARPGAGFLSFPLSLATPENAITFALLSQSLLFLHTPHLLSSHTHTSPPHFLAFLRDVPPFDVCLSNYFVSFPVTFYESVYPRNIIIAHFFIVHVSVSYSCPGFTSALYIFHRSLR